MKNKFVIVAIAAFLMLLMACNPETPVQYHKVTYIGADGNVMETHDVENGKTDIPPQENPKNIGHEFIGWSLSKDGKSIYDFKTPVTGELTLYPVWEINSYKVTFICGEDVVDPPSEITLDYGSTIPPQNVTKTGYVLKGWSTKEDGSVPYDLSTSVTGDVTLYPIWGKTCTITYICDEDIVGTPKDITVDINTVVDAPEEPSKTGYSFKGWKTSLDSKDFFSFGAISSDVTLYPIFEGKEMTVNFIYEDKETINSKTLKTGDKISLSDLVFKLFEKDYALDERIYTIELVDAGTGTTYPLDDPLPYSETGFTFVCHIKSKLLTVDESGAVAGADALVDIEGPYTLIIPRYLNGVKASTIKKTGFYYSGWDKKYQFDKLILPNTLTSIGENAFDSCGNLAEVEIPSSVELINAGSFNYCTTLSKINIPEGVETIGAGVFANCYALSEINLPSSLATIGEFSFSSCGFVSFTLPKQFTAVPDGMLTSCTKLTTVIFEGDITKIGANAFADCDALTSFTIPDTVTTIGDGAFDNCDNLETIILPGNANITEVSNYLFNGCWKLTNITIPNSVTKIGDNAFNNCGSLKSITIPENVTKIGAYAFSSSGLTSITIPSSVTSIGAYAFYACSALTGITINGEIVTIQERTFDSCTSLKSIKIPDSVTTIGESAFALSGLTSFVIPNNVTSLGSNTFSRCYNLNTITIGTGVSSIPRKAFEFCTSLKSITIPANVKTIGDYAFLNCTSLSSITLNDGLQKIGKNVIEDCSSLATITIPSSVTSIEEDAFYHCQNLFTIYIDQTINSIDGAPWAGDELWSQNEYKRVKKSNFHLQWTTE